VDTAEGFGADEALQTLHAQGELPQRQRTLRRQAARAEPFEVLGQVVLRAVDDPQVLAAAGLEGGLDEAAAVARDKVEGLDDHALPASGRQVVPPSDRGLLARGIGHIHRLEGRGEQDLGIGSAGLRQRFHVPDVVAIDVDSCGRRQQVEGRELQVGQGFDGPTVAAVSLDVGRSSGLAPAVPIK